jgi:hypothetical protein
MYVYISILQKNNNTRLRCSAPRLRCSATRLRCSAPLLRCSAPRLRCSATRLRCSATLGSALLRSATITEWPVRWVELSDQTCEMRSMRLVMSSSRLPVFQLDREHWYSQLRVNTQPFRRIVLQRNDGDVRVRVRVCVRVYVFWNHLQTALSLQDGYCSELAPLSRYSMSNDSR